MKITKRSGVVALYDDEKVVSSILKANAGIAEETVAKKEAATIANEVFDTLTREKEIITTADVRRCVYENLNKRGFPLTAERYRSYKKKA